MNELLPAIASDVSPQEPAEACTPSGLLAKVDVPVQSADLALTSGRRCEVRALPEGDRITVIARDGAVLLRVLMTDRGPVLAFESADVEIAAAGTLVLSGQHVAVQARESLDIRCDGDSTTTVAGTRHTRVGAADRLEASAIAVQASEGAAEIRAAGRIALDGEHIGLNDDPCPQPFPWSALATSIATDRDAE